MNEQPAQPEGIDLAALLRVLRRRLPVIALCALLTIAGAIGLSLLQEKEYETGPTLRTRDPVINFALFGSAVPSSDPQRDVETTLSLVTEPKVAEATAEGLGGYTVEEIADAVELRRDEGSDLFSIVASSTDPDEAARIANVYTEEFQKFDRRADRGRLTEARETIESQLDRIESGGFEEFAKERKVDVRQLRLRAQNLELLSGLRPGNVDLVAEATVPTDPVRPDIVQNLAVGAFIGLLLGVGLALAVEHLDRRINRPEEVEELLGLPLLGSVPKSPLLGAGAIAAAETGSPEGEAFRMIWTNLRFFNATREVKAVLITSAEPGDGKSTFSVNLAAAAASSGSSVLLVEADVRNPSFDLLLDLPEARGLTDYLVGDERKPPTREIVIGPGVDGDGPRRMDVLTAGPAPPNPGQLLDSKRMRKLIAEARDEYDLLVIDAPPVAIVSDAIPLLREVDGVIAVTHLGENTRDAVAGLGEQFNRLNANALGFVANFAGKPDYRYYGYYGFGAAGPPSPVAAAEPLGGGGTRS
jgi:tyrosine-protein kinase